MIRVVLDSNVWISAMAYRGRVRLLLEALREKRFEAVISGPLLAEILRVLGSRKIGLSPESLTLIEAEIRQLAVVVYPTLAVRTIPDDPDDDRVLECALAGGARWIVSGDRHLLKLKVFRGIRIVDPASFAREILKDGEGTYGSSSDETGQDEPHRVNETAPKYRAGRSGPKRKATAASRL